MTPRQRLLAAIKGDPELVARLLVVAEPSGCARLSTPDDAYSVLAPHLEGWAEERLVVVALDRRNRPIATQTMTIGSAGHTVVCPRQIFRWALLQGRSGASGVILGHNHPSGDPTPSAQDIDVTRRVRRAGEVLGVPLLDHIVVAGGTYARVVT